MGAIDLAWVTFGRALFVRLAAVAAFLAVVMAILFAPNGMTAHEAVRILDRSIVTKLVVWAVWLALVVPPIAEAMQAPGTSIVRSLPVREGHFAASVFGIVAITQAPWGVLFGRGDGVGRGFSALCISVAFSAVLVGRWRTRLVGVPVATALVLAPSFLAAPIAIALGALAAFDGWRHGAQPPLAIMIPIPRSALLAIVVAEIVLLVRTERTRIVIVFAFGALVRALASRLDAEAFSRPITLLTLTTSLLASIMAPPLVREAARFAWIVPRAWIPLACAAAVLAVVASAFAWWTGPIAIAQIGIAERARKKNWGGSRFGFSTIAFAVAVTTLVGYLA